MTADRQRALRALVPAAYAAAFMLVFLPLADVAVSVWPMQPDQYHWRYAATGALAGSLLMPTLGLLLGILTATLAGHRRALKLLGGLSLLLVAGFAIDLFLFSRDAGLVGRRLVDGARTAFHVGEIKTGAKLALSASALAFFGLGAFAAVREIMPIDPQGDPVQLGQVMVVARSKAGVRPKATADA